MPPHVKHKSSFPSYDVAKKIVANAGINTVVAYRAWYKISPTKLPYNPQNCYRKSWKTWYDFFGKDTRTIVSYEDAIALVSEHSINTFSEYRGWYKSCEKRLPSFPPREYVDDWVDWHIFFGLSSKYVPFKEAKLTISEAGINTVADYLYFYRTLHGRFPSSPALIYSEWISWKDFLSKT